MNLHDDTRTDVFYHRRSKMVGLVGLLGFLLALVILAVLVGPEFGKARYDWLKATLAIVGLSSIMAIPLWVLWKRPAALTIGPDGIYLPVVFKKPLPWADIHRIKRTRATAGLYGYRDWLIVDPSPGVLAPLRLPVWRALELRLQKHHGVRIPLHGLSVIGDDVVASVERFRPVTQDDT